MKSVFTFHIQTKSSVNYDAYFTEILYDVNFLSDRSSIISEKNIEKKCEKIVYRIWRVCYTRQGVNRIRPVSYIRKQPIFRGWTLRPSLNMRRLRPHRIVI